MFDRNFFSVSINKQIGEMRSARGTIKLVDGVELKLRRVMEVGDSYVWIEHYPNGAINEAFRKSRDDGRGNTIF